MRHLVPALELGRIAQGIGVATAEQREQDLELVVKVLRSYVK
jgi:hypothetical protein